MVDASRDRAGEFVPIGRIDADGVALRLQGGDRLFHMRKGRIGQAAEIDHIGAVRAHGLGARHHLFDGQGRRIDDFGEDAHRMAREIRRRSLSAEMGGQVGEFVRPALEGHAEMRREPVQIGAASAGQHDAIGLHGTLQAPLDDVAGGKRRDLDPDIGDRPVEIGLAEAYEKPFEPWMGQMPGQEENAFARHGRLCRRSSGACQARRLVLRAEIGAISAGDRLMASRGDQPRCHLPSRHAANGKSLTRRHEVQRTGDEEVGAGAQHRGEAVIDDARASQGIEIGIGRNVDQLDEAEIGLFELTGKPSREGIGGHRPVLGNVGIGHDHVMRQPDGYAPGLMGNPDRFHASGADKALGQIGESAAELLHGERRHLMGRAVVETETNLEAPHHFGKRPASGHHDERCVRLFDRRDPPSQMRRTDRTSSQLDDCRFVHGGTSQKRACRRVSSATQVTKDVAHPLTFLVMLLTHLTSVSFRMPVAAT